jgi:hypothetical protein
MPAPKCDHNYKWGLSDSPLGKYETAKGHRYLVCTKCGSMLFPKALNKFF